MPELVAWLDAPALMVAGVPVSWAELLGDLTGALSVALVARGNILNWPIGLLNNVFWSWLFYRAKLYSDSALQGVFFVLGIYGWVRWSRGGRRLESEAREALPVRRIRGREALALGGFVVIATASLATFLAGSTDSPAPLADASVLTLSLAATWAQAEKVLESWWIWILVDVVSVPLYWSRALYPTAILYAIFGAICVVGLRAWSRELARSEVPCRREPLEPSAE